MFERHQLGLYEAGSGHFFWFWNFHEVADGGGDVGEGAGGF